MKNLIVILMSFLLSSCWSHTPSKNEEELAKSISQSLNTDKDSVDEDNPTIGQYVYIDRTGCLHIQRDCYSLDDNDQMILYAETSDEKTESSLDIKGVRYALHRISVKGQLKIEDLNFCCTKCVNDSNYNILKREVSYNSERKNLATEDGSVDLSKVPPSRRHLYE